MKIEVSKIGILKNYSRMEFWKINFKSWNFEKLNLEIGILENWNFEELFKNGILEK